MDEFGWILIGALVFIVVISIAWLPSRGPSPLVDPKSVDLNIVAGSGTAFYITINGSKEGEMKDVNLTVVDCAQNWVSFDKNMLDIEDSERVMVSVVVPKGTTGGSYVGRIKISSPGGETFVTMRINVVSINELKIRSRPIYLGDVNVKYSVGSELISSGNDIEITKSSFSQTNEAMNITIPSQKLQITTGGYLNLTIGEINDAENLVVIFNGYKIYDRSPSLGNVIIPIDESMIGNQNSMLIYTESPPWYKFWSKSVYKIENFGLFINYQDTMERERLFDLKDEEIANFDSFKLTGSVDRYSSPLGEMEIKINNQLVYSNRPPLSFFNETFRSDVLGNALYFRNTDNVISFSFEQSSLYDLEDAFLIVYYR